METLWLVAAGGFGLGVVTTWLWMRRGRARLAETFAALSAEALRQNNATFLELAGLSLERFRDVARDDHAARESALEGVVRPVRETLEKVERRIGELEQARAGGEQALHAQVRALMEAQAQLRMETGRLAQALRSPVVRGRWGEVQLRRVVELAGMQAHCDFTEQATLSGAESRQRPDLVVRLPGGRQIAVDAKAPLGAYLEAQEASEEAARAQALARHAQAVRAHVEALSRKAYWEALEGSSSGGGAVEFVVLFLPGESFFSAALEGDPALIEYGSERHVILATPTTLISLLKAVSYGWRQEALEQSTREVARLGRELYKRLCDMGGHMEKVGRHLNQTVEAYNGLAANAEGRVLAAARRFRELEPSGPEAPPAPRPVEKVARAPRAAEWATPDTPPRP